MSTLAELIAAHRAANEAFCSTLDAEQAARDALGKLQGSAPITTPVRIRGGKVVMALEVTGEDQERDQRRIKDEHDEWAIELSVARIEAVAPAAAKAIRKEIARSLQRCLDHYRDSTVPLLEERNAPFQPPIAAWREALDADNQALEAVINYRPTTVAEVAIQASYVAEASPSHGELEDYVVRLAAMVEEPAIDKAA
jgi:hypothetical protein